MREAPRSALTPRECMIIGSAVHTQTYALTRSDLEASRFLMDRAFEKLDEARRAGSPSVSMFATAYAQTMDPAFHVVYLWAGRWCDNGFPAVVLGHKQAASYMCTSAAAALADDLTPPWSAFLVHLPTGLLDVEDARTGRRCPASLVFVHRLDTGAWNMAVVADDVIVHRRHVAPERLFDIDYGEREHVPLAMEQALTDRDDRLMVMVARLVVGICLMNRAGLVQTKGKSSSRGNGKGRSARETNEAPKTRAYIVAHDVQIDCRSAVRDFVDGRTNRSPSVQILVRGHWKRQVYGEGRTKRRLVHIEPYWRGPEDAPIAVRKHVVLDEKA